MIVTVEILLCRAAPVPEPEAAAELEPAPEPESDTNTPFCRGGVNILSNDPVGLTRRTDSTSKSLDFISFGFRNL